MSPIDISREPLRRAAEEVAADFPEVPVVAVCADYLQPLSLPALPARGDGRRLGFFPGSTIGNFAPEARSTSWRAAGAWSAAAAPC